MNRNKPQAAAPTQESMMTARPTSRRQRVGWMLAVVALIATTLSASLFATTRSRDDDSERIQKICAANNGHWERTATGGACIDTGEWLLD